MNEIIPGCFIEPYAIVDGERRHIPNTTHDIDIDVQTGAVEFTILLDTELEGLIGAFLAGEDGEFTGREEYDRFELDIYGSTEDAEPIIRYYADFPAVEADICLPIDPDVILSETFVVVEPEGKFGFRNLATPEEWADEGAEFESQDIPEAEQNDG